MNHDAIKHIIDGFSFGLVVTTLYDALPKEAALVSIIWIGIQIYDRIKYGPKNRSK